VLFVTAVLVKKLEGMRERVECTRGVRTAENRGLQTQAVVVDQGAERPLWMAVNRSTRDMRRLRDSPLREVYPFAARSGALRDGPPAGSVCGPFRGDTPSSSGGSDGVGGEGVQRRIPDPDGRRDLRSRRGAPHDGTHEVGRRMGAQRARLHREDLGEEAVRARPAWESRRSPARACRVQPLRAPMTVDVMTLLSVSGATSQGDGRIEARKAGVPHPHRVIQTTGRVEPAGCPHARSGRRCATTDDCRHDGEQPTKEESQDARSL